MTDELFTALSHFEGVFRTAVRWHYVRISKRDRERLAKLYRMAGGNLPEGGCSACDELETIQQIAAFYYTEKERRNGSKEDY